MPGKSLFEYAVIRIVPRVEREEFLNVGVVLYCREQQFLGAKYHIDPARVKAFADQSDTSDIEENLRAFLRICEGADQGGAIGKLEQAERFRWLTAMRSTVVQTSRVHPGFCSDAAKTLEHLYEQMVL